MQYLNSQMGEVIYLSICGIDLKKVHVIHTVEVITRKNQHIFNVFSSGILQSKKTLQFVQGTTLYFSAVY